MSYFPFTSAPRKQVYHSEPLSDIESPVTAEELADWARADDTDPVLNAMLVVATQQVVDTIQRELINRSRRVVYQEWPINGEHGNRQLSASIGEYQSSILLPYAQLQQVDTCKVYNVETTDFTPQFTLPATIQFEAVPYLTSDSDFPALDIEYTAGFGVDASAVPSALKQAVTMLAAFYYDHRGACDANMALEQSGAKALLTPYMAEVVVL